MEKANDLMVVYNMGNFHNGKVAQTHDKMVKEAYEAAGYKLISTVFMSFAQYLSRGKK
jgi:hypothetical protein